MNFSFWPFLWFGLPGRLLTLRVVGVDLSCFHLFCSSVRFLRGPDISLGGRFDFFLFFCSGPGKGESEALGRGGGLFFENPRTGGAEGPEGCLRRIGEFRGGFNFFFRAEMPLSITHHSILLPE